MEGNCIKHQFEPAADLCRTCGNAFCTECLVYSFGAHEPPFCVACALAAAGVRSNAARQPTLSRRELRRQVRQRHKEAKAHRLHPDREERSPVEIDWSIPGQADDEDREAFDWATPDEPTGSGPRVPF